MITSKHISQVLDSIQKWRKEKKKLVIGIDGYSGVGKTTLLKEINNAINDILVVYRDDFIAPSKERNKRFQKSKDKAKMMKYEIVDINEIRSFIEKYKLSNNIQEYYLYNGKTGKRDVLCKFDFSKSILIIEGIFLFHPKQFDDLFDKRIFLDANQEKADKRRREREMKRWGDDYFPDTHPDSYFRLTKIAFNDYIKKYKPEERADIVLKID